jgi:hypothetical protein
VQSTLFRRKATEGSSLEVDIEQYFSGIIYFREVTRKGKQFQSSQVRKPREVHKKEVCFQILPVSFSLTVTVTDMKKNLHPVFRWESRAGGQKDLCGSLLCLKANREETGFTCF